MRLMELTGFKAPLQLQAITSTIQKHTWLVLHDLWSATGRKAMRLFIQIPFRNMTSAAATARHKAGTQHQGSLLVAKA